MQRRLELWVRQRLAKQESPEARRTDLSKRLDELQTRAGQARHANVQARLATGSASEATQMNTLIGTMGAMRKQLAAERERQGVYQADGGGGWLGMNSDQGTR